MRWLDYKVGTTLFLPWIIRLLQATGMTQYAFHRYLWLVVALFAFSQCQFDNVWGWVGGLIIGLMCLVFVYTAGRHPNKPAPPNNFLRYVFLGFTLGDLVLWWLPGVDIRWTRYAIDFAVLAAEYALLIDKIPPLGKGQKAAPKVLAPE